MCINFRDLNKACPKGFYPLPQIDQLVDSTSGCELHQFMLAPEDRKKPEDCIPIFFHILSGVKMSLPLKQTLGKPNTSGCLVKWAVELSEYDILYLPRTTNEAQALVDFVSKIAGISLEDTSKTKKWLLRVDGSSTIRGSSAGIVITSPQGEDLEFAVKFDFKASNHEAEYETLVEGMKMAHEARARHLVASSNSQLIVKQVEGAYEAKDEKILQYLQ
ncbi:UNVERIFIED_CONTAM: hypothetical protein Sradi_4002100 [Sesamum radiatum]|uniref:RNase H type-1 domain-containing protein n=1 Tax=Sesamum radiatum TaxID=300843 RepID=A0AAW2PI31_SESRA